MKKKIIFVSTALWIGGIETALVNLIHSMDYNKYEITLMILKAELDMLPQIDPRCRVIIADREKVYSFSSPYQYKKLFHLTEEAENPSAFHRAMMWTVPVIRFFENALWIRYIKGNLKEESFDSCIIYSDVTAEVAIKAVQADKYIMFYHHGAMRRVYHDTIGYKRSSKVVAVSNRQAAMLKKFVPAYSDKIMTIHNLADTKGVIDKSTQPMDDYFDPDLFHITSVGRMSYEKGMDLAVKCCGELVRRGHDKLHWWIIGNGPAYDDVQREIAKKQLEQYVSTVGMRPNPYPYVKAADLYVQPSRFEGYPMTLLEALALDQPIISTDNDGAKEIVRDGIDGILCSIDSIALADAIEDVMKDDDKLERLRQAARQVDVEARNQQSIKQLEAII